MKRPDQLVREFFDVRTGEHVRLWAMFFYLLFVLFAYYVVKPVSRAMFLTKFDVDKLPLLYILIAIFGGILAYLYGKVATVVSLKAAVTWAMGLSTAALVVMWYLIHLRIPWMVYVLNIWVSLFSVVLVSQGWLVAGNLFDSRQAKRLYPILDMGMVLGAALGGEFTKRMVSLIGTEALLLASAALVLIAYLAFLAAGKSTGTPIQEAKGDDTKDTGFSFGQIVNDLSRVRHLRIIVGMMIVMYLVDTLVEYQFQAAARSAYKGDSLTAYFGQFYGLWLNGVEFIFQLFLTGLIVRWFGIGATLQISPVTVGLASLTIIAAPGVLATSGVRLAEASTRYTLSKTGMELLYMPLPLALRNRIKAFIDIFVDRMSRGVGGILLLFLTVKPLHLTVSGIAVVVIALCAVWVAYSVYARREYILSIRSRLSSSRLDLASVRVSVSDGSTIKVLEEAAQSANARQAVYSLSLLAESPGYDLTPILKLLIGSPICAVRDRVWQLAAARQLDQFGSEVSEELSSKTPNPHAVTYAVTAAPGREEHAARLLYDDRVEVVEMVLEALRGEPKFAHKVLSHEWLGTIVRSRDPRQRALAAAGAAAFGGPATEILHDLLNDPSQEVVLASLRAAGVVRNRAHLYQLIQALAKAPLRAAAIDALVAFGPGLTGTFSDVLNDQELDVRVRRQIPRVLRRIPTQDSIRVLLPVLAHSDLRIRSEALKALNRIRETEPQLNFDDAVVTEQLLAEARHYYELTAAFAPLRAYRMEPRTGPHAALRLLARTMDERLKDTLARLFRLLGLRYPPKDIYSAYLAVAHPTQHDATAALEFLDNVLDNKIKRVLLPLLDAPQFALDRGRELFGVQVPTFEQALRAQAESEDPWMAACATAASHELKLTTIA